MPLLKQIVMRVYTIFAVILTIAMLTGCTTGGGSTVDLVPFVGGSSGVSISFTPDLRGTVYDGGGDPFDITLIVENKGEARVLADQAKIELLGIMPEEFRKTPDEMVLSPDEDLEPVTKDSEGNTNLGTTTYVDFLELNHVSPVTGAALSYPLSAQICYLYATTGVSKICVRKDLLSPAEGGVCELLGTKAVYSSGAPIQIQNVVQTQRGKDKIGFSFDVAHVGAGKVYQPGSGCPDVTRSKDKLRVKVDLGRAGLRCTSLEQTSGTSVEGLIDLYQGKKTVSCTYDVKSFGDYEMPIKIEAEYDYQESVSTTLTVKSAGEQAAEQVVEEVTE